MKNFKLVLKSLVNNEACVEGGRHRPWWIAIILFFLSMIIALVPIFVQTITKSGSSFVSSTSYGIEVGLQRFIEDVNDKDLSLAIKEASDGDKYLNLEQTKWDETYTYVNNSGYHAYQHLVDGVSDFDVFYYADIDSNNETLSTVYNAIINDRKVDTTNEETGEVSTTYEKRNTSFMLLGKKTLRIYLYNGTSTSALGSCIGDYKSFDDGYDIRKINEVTINDNVITYKNVDADNYTAYRNGVWSNWKQFFDDSYQHNRMQATWTTTLLMFGINALLVIFMGFMIWVLTRGKANPFRIYKFYECELIACWAAFTPSILGLAVGFMFSSFAVVTFPLFLGVRVMWLSMKTLRPQYNYVPEQNQKKTKDVKTVDVKSKKKGK